MQMERIKERMVEIIKYENVNKIIVGYSGGKDSTVLLHFALEVAKERNLKLIIVHSDTLVENPIIHEYVFKTLNLVKEYSSHGGIDIEIRVAKPDIKNTFWVNVIGKGYPLPYHKFRWCQDKLKIKPIKKVLRGLERAVMFVGLREGESSDRSRSLRGRLNKNFKIQNGKVPTYAPMVDVSEEEIWRFLLKSSPPYNASYKKVIEIYKEARGGCPLIPSKDNYKNGCGMRFGCWVCTLVREDKTLKNQMLVNDKLVPLYEFRSYMIKVYSLPKNRSGLRRNGIFIGEGKGTLKISARKQLFRKLLELQEKIGKELISEAEIEIIQKIWKEDEERFGDIIT